MPFYAPVLSEADHRFVKFAQQLKICWEHKKLMKDKHDLSAFPHVSLLSFVSGGKTCKTGRIYD